MQIGVLGLTKDGKNRCEQTNLSRNPVNQGKEAGLKGRMCSYEYDKQKEKGRKISVVSQATNAGQRKN